MTLYKKTHPATEQIFYDFIDSVFPQCIGSKIPGNLRKFFLVVSRQFFCDFVGVKFCIFKPSVAIPKRILIIKPCLPGSKSLLLFIFFHRNRILTEPPPAFPSDSFNRRNIVLKPSFFLNFPNRHIFSQYCFLFCQFFFGRILIIDFP